MSTSSVGGSFARVVEVEKKLAIFAGVTFIFHDFRKIVGFVFGNVRASVCLITI